MNLIEQLGGYQKAKVMLRGLGNEHESLLLEYRRENNIFEVGDRVVMISKRRSSKLWTWVHTTNWRPNHSLLKNDKENCLYPIRDDKYRHATTQEIAQGYRDE